MKNIVLLFWSRTPPSLTSTTAPVCTVSPDEARRTFLTRQSDSVTSCSNPSMAPAVYKVKAEFFHAVHRDPHHLAPAHLPGHISWKLPQPPLPPQFTFYLPLQPHEYVMPHLSLPPGSLLSPPLNDLLLALQRQVMKLPLWEAFSEPPLRLSWGAFAVGSHSHSP